MKRGNLAWKEYFMDNESGWEMKALGSEFCVNESQAHTVEMNRCQDVLYYHLNRS